MSLLGNDTSGVQNPAFMDTSMALKGKRNSVQPGRTSVMKKQTLMGEGELLSPAGTVEVPDHLHRASNENSEIESRHQISGMETQTD